jgi:hypothetical protein
MIDKTMCEVLWWNSSDFYVNLRVEVGKHPQVLIWVWTATFSQVVFINILWVSTVFSTPYLFLDTAARLQWPVTQISASQQFFLIRLLSHLIFVLVPECGEYEICNQKIILRSISRRRPFFIDRFHS